jgi:hypothetical protein
MTVRSALTAALYTALDNALTVPVSSDMRQADEGVPSVLFGVESDEATRFAGGSSGPISTTFTVTCLALSRLEAENLGDAARLAVEGAGVLARYVSSDTDTFFRGSDNTPVYVQTLSFTAFTGDA